MKTNLKPGDVIKHEKFLDVAIYVTSVGQLEYGATSVQIGGIYMNQGFTKSWIIATKRGIVRADITIKFTDLDKWFICVDPEKDVCLRKCDWVRAA